MTDHPGQNDAFVEAVAEAIDRRRLLPSGSAVVVAVSGGADSVALLAVLRELASDPGRLYRLHVAHLNHRLRAGTDDDADFVADLARQWALPLVLEARDVAAEARRTGHSVEQAARAVRYEFLTRVARQLGAARVAVAHHADDNVETVLQRLLRGTHLRGLCGMRPLRPLEDSGVVLVRPLLDCRRSQIEAYLRGQGLAWRTDPSNTDVRYRRNFIRHELLPLVRDRLSPAADQALLRLAEAAQEVEDFLAEMAEQVLRRARRESSPSRSVMDADELSPAPALLRRYAIRAEMERLGMPMREVDATLLVMLGDLPGLPPPASVSLPGGGLARREGSALVLVGPQEDRELPPGGPANGTSTHPADDGPAQPAETQVQPAQAQPPIELACPGRTVLPDGRQVTCRIVPHDAAAFAEHCRTHPAGTEWMDADRLTGHLVCRQRQAGDAFDPLGGGGRQTVSNFLTNLKLPRAQRRQVLCICDQGGIVYLAPLRLDQRVRVVPSTRNVLHLTVSPHFGE